MDIRKFFGPERGIRHWNCLPRVVAESLVWEVFKESLGVAINALLELP